MGTNPFLEFANPDSQAPAFDITIPSNSNVEKEVSKIISNGVSQSNPFSEFSELPKQQTATGLVSTKPINILTPRESMLADIDLEATTNAGRIFSNIATGIPAGIVGGIAATGRFLAGIGGGTGLPQEVDLPRENVTQALADSQKVLEQVAELPYIKPRNSTDATTEKIIGEGINYPFKMAGEGLQELVKLTPLEGTIAEPIAGTLGEFAAVLALGGSNAIKGRATQLNAALEKNINWYNNWSFREALKNNPERALVVQTLEDMMRSGISEAEAIRKYPWLFNEALERRNKGIGVQQPSTPNQRTTEGGIFPESPKEIISPTDEGSTIIPPYDAPTKLSPVEEALRIAKISGLGQRNAPPQRINAIQDIIQGTRVPVEVAQEPLYTGLDIANKPQSGIFKGIIEAPASSIETKQPEISLVPEYSPLDTNLAVKTDSYLRGGERGTIKIPETLSSKEIIDKKRAIDSQKIDINKRIVELNLTEDKNPEQEWELEVLLEKQKDLIKQSLLLSKEINKTKEGTFPPEKEIGNIAEEITIPKEQDEKKISEALRIARQAGLKNIEGGDLNGLQKEGQKETQVEVIPAETSPIIPKLLEDSISKKVEVVGEVKEPIVKKPKAGQNIKKNPFEYQNTNQETVIHSKWDNGNNFRYVLEGTGDVFRELVIRKEPDLGYISEKLNRIKYHIKKELSKKIHPEDTIEYSKKNNPEKFIKMAEQWNKQPFNSDIQKVAVDLNRAMINGDFKSSLKYIETIENYFKKQRQEAPIVEKVKEVVKTQPTIPVKEVPPAQQEMKPTAKEGKTELSPDEKLSSTIKEIGTLHKELKIKQSEIDSLASRLQAVNPDKVRAQEILDEHLKKLQDSKNVVAKPVQKAEVVKKEVTETQPDEPKYIRSKEEITDEIQKQKEELKTTLQQIKEEQDPSIKNILIQARDFSIGEIERLNSFVKDAPSRPKKEVYGEVIEDAVSNLEIDNEGITNDNLLEDSNSLRNIKETVKKEFGAKTEKPVLTGRLKEISDEVDARLAKKDFNKEDMAYLKELEKERKSLVKEEETVGEIVEDIVLPEEAKFLNITENQTVIDINGEPQELKKGEQLRIEKNDDDTFHITDGDEYDVTLANLENIKGEFTNTPNLASGGIAKFWRVKNQKPVSDIVDEFNKSKDLNKKHNMARQIEKRVISSIGTVLSRETKAGKEMTKLIQDTYIEGELLGGKWVADYQKIVKNLSPSELVDLVAILEGRTEPVKKNSKVAKASEELRDLLNEPVKLLTKMPPEDRLTVSHPNVKKWKIVGSRGEWDLLDENGEIVYTDTNKSFVDIVLKAHLQTPFSPRENYFPRMIKRELVEKKMEELIDHLVNTGQINVIDKVTGNKLDRDTQREIARSKITIYMRRNSERRYGNLQIARELDLPQWAYEHNPNVVLPVYFSKAGMRITEAQNWGAKDQVLTKFKDSIIEQGGDAEFSTRALDRILHKEPFDASADSIVRALTTYQIVTKMGLSQIAQIGQNFNSLFRGNLSSFLKGQKDAFKNNEEAQDFFIRAGSGLHEVLRQAREDMVGSSSGVAERYLKILKFTAADMRSRYGAVLIGRYYAEHLVDKLKNNYKKLPPEKKQNYSARYAIRRLEQLNLNPNEIINRGFKLTEEEKIKAGQKFEIDTNFRNRAIDMPEFWTSRWGRVITQFKSFSYAQTKMLRDNVIKEAGHGNIMPLIYLLVIGQIGGEAINDIRGLITGRKQSENYLNRMLGNYAVIGGIGMFDMLFSTLKYGDTQFGATHSTILKGAKGVADVFKGNFKTGVSFVLGEIPLIGQRLKREYIESTESKATKTKQKNEEKYWKNHRWNVRGVVPGTPPQKKKN